MSVATELPVLTGNNLRVLLRPMTVEDQPIFRAYITESAELRRLIDNPSIPTEEDQVNWFRRCQEPDRQIFTIETLSSMEVVGNAGFTDIGVEEGEVQLRITIADAYQGIGLGFETMGLLLLYAFKVQKWSAVWLKVLPDNARAIRLYEKCGFRIIPSTLEDAGKIRMMLERTHFLPPLQV